MIYSEIEGYLQQVGDADLHELLSTAVNVLDLFNYPDYVDVLDNAIGDHSDEGDVAVIDALRNRVHEMITTILAQHGVELTKEATLAQATKVAHALALINHADDKNVLMLALEGEQGAEETFALLVSMVVDFHPENLLALIENLDAALIERLREFIVQPNAEHLPDAAEVNKRSAEYAKYKVVFANDEHWCDRFADRAEALNLPFDCYAALYMSGQVKIDLQNVQNDEALAFRKVCVNFIGMACLCSDGSSSVLDNAHPYLERVYPEITSLTRLYTKLQQLNLEFHRAQT